MLATKEMEKETVKLSRVVIALRYISHRRTLMIMCILVSLPLVHLLKRLELSLTLAPPTPGFSIRTLTLEEKKRNYHMITMHHLLLKRQSKRL